MPVTQEVFNISQYPYNLILIKIFICNLNFECPVWFNPIDMVILMQLHV